MRIAVILAVALCACAREDASRGGARTDTSAATLDCGVGQSAVLGDSGIGSLRIGVAVDDLRSRCRVISDTNVPGIEGTRERRIVVALGANPTAATIVDNRVWRIEVETPRFRTADSLGVRTTGAQLKRGPGRIASGEGAVFALRQNHCGLSFRVRGVSPSAVWRTMPDSARVDRVLIIGCSALPR
jgi:hypothetical protein